MRTSTIATSGVYDRTFNMEVVGAAGAADYLVPRLFEQRRDALAQQRVIVSDDDAEGSRGIHQASIEVAKIPELA